MQNMQCVKECNQIGNGVFYYQHSDNVCNTTPCSVSEETYVFETASHVCVESCLFTKPTELSLQNGADESKLVQYTRCYDACETNYYKNVTYFLYGRPFEVVVCVNCSTLEDTMHGYLGANGCVDTCPEQHPYKKYKSSTETGVMQCTERCSEEPTNNLYFDTFVCAPKCPKYKFYNETAHGYKCVNVCPDETPFVQDDVCVKGC